MKVAAAPPLSPGHRRAWVHVRGAVGLQVLRAVGSSAATDADDEPRAVVAEFSVESTTATRHR
jgi:hypothetical protein